ncbi:hypothetical protein F4861DRAFT_522017 [Xylaria intraflava]|nr:hypothetical protein F4861DRAFT_522017 [Xylaria intraflava]
MTHCMLFCTAEEAKAFVPQVMTTGEGLEYFPYALAESRQGFSPDQPFRDSLQDNETFETDFIGASVNECGAWLLEQQTRSNMLDQNIMVVVDARSAKDQTVTLWVYPIHDAPFLRRDQEANVWHPFRIHYSKVFKLAVDFTDVGSPDETYGVLFRRKEELTGEDGLFDLDRATELVLNGEGVILEDDQYYDRA